MYVVDESSAGSATQLASIEPRQLGLGPVFFRTRDAVIVAEVSLGRIVLWNDAAVAMFGYTKAEGFGLSVEDLVPEPLKEQHRTGLARYAQHGEGVLIDSGMHVELPALRKDGTQLWIELSLTPLEAEGVTSRYAMAIVRDITDRKEADRVLRQSHAVLEGTQALARVGSWEWDTTAGPAVGVQWSREMYRIHGVDPGSFDMSKDAIDALIHPDDRDMWESNLTMAVASRADLEGFSYRAVRPDGTTRVVWTEGCFYPDRPEVLVGFVQDITEQKAAADELARLALVDELTGLRNRRGFLTAAEPLLKIAHRDRRDVILLYIDLDNMKAINDRYGHAVGDDALVATANLLSDTFRESDLIGRLGGDEFCVLLHGTNGHVPVTRLNEAVRARLGSDPVIELSIGAAERGANDTSPIEELLARADAAMYEAKIAKGRR